MSTEAEWIAFEHPLNERVRFYLRLEFLFAELAHHRRDESAWGLRASLHVLLDLLSVMGRTDLRGELLKVLADQQARLTRLAKRPDVNRQRLDEVLQALAASLAGLQSMSSAPPALFLREHEFLFAIFNRSSIPGGACGFDLPAYHRWLARPYAQSRQDLDGWYARLAPIERAIALDLRLLRESTEPADHVAEGGVFLQAPQTACQLIRVLVPASADVYPEISAGKHRVSLRFMRLGDVNTRNVQAGGSIPFRLQCCALAGCQER
ncbi:MAG: cell division protein ZapD [Sinobacteraceae bacterium]|nr:cell division protein ZapD [Nevskiaceae bacterium]